MIRIGTSGYSYDDWVGPFYPEGTDKREFLGFYARHFDCNEVNYTYYRMPTAGTLCAMAEKTPPDFRFVIKAHGSMTHQRDADAAAFDEFISALEPLRQQGKLACVLAQFPGSFRLSQPNVDYLKRFRQVMAGVPVVVEFRSDTWLRDEMFAFLREASFGFCCVDQPRISGLLPPVAEVTSSIAYLRFHGRNAAKWRQHDEAWERYNYLYSREELEPWVPKVRSMAVEAAETYVFFNNHYNAQAVQNARDFADLLEDAP
ncbi:MAG: DUF72 domain-containing protein [Armatimonadota bacterium]|jgi:uncharacterized protein YecE (DUF72 family)